MYGLVLAQRLPLPCRCRATVPEGREAALRSCWFTFVKHCVAGSNASWIVLILLSWERRVSRLYFAKQMEKGHSFWTVIVLLQGDVVAVDPIRYLPSCCQHPLSHRFWAMEDLTRSALYALAQEPKAQGLSTIFSRAASHSIRGQAWLPGGARWLPCVPLGAAGKATFS